MHCSSGWGICRFAMAIWAACASASSAEVTGQLALPEDPEFKNHVVQCSQQYGYDPTEADRLGPNELGSGELAWRECVYQGLRDIVMPKSPIPQAYASAIAEDQALTEQVQRGELTRTERRKRLKDLLDGLRLGEELNKPATTVQTSDDLPIEPHELEQLRDMYHSSVLNTLGY